ncbi:MAG TPA: sialidase family protein [Puia sp.]|nr:sialidase family protein [Puia sp.]
MKRLFLPVSSIMGICFLLLSGNNCYGQSLNFIYKAGDEGYSCFRIPAMVTTKKGTVLAISEGRRNNCGDAGDIDLVVKRSFDGGKTWGPLQVIWSDSTNTCGNPSPVVDNKTGEIILLSTWNLGTDHEKNIVNQTSRDTRKVFVLSSADDGSTWSSPQDITKSVKQDNWTWYATGPGAAIQIKKGKYKGRLVVACDHIEAVSKTSCSHTIYSDDDGKTWVLGGTVPQGKVNESTVAELPDSRLMLNMRNAGEARYRQVAFSTDGGKSWSDIHADSTLIEPVCQGSLIQYSYRSKKKFMVFSNPASKTSREAMTVRLSYDKGKTWPLSKLLYSGPSAYSCLAVLPDGNIACLFEAGYAKAYEGLVFSEIELKAFSNQAGDTNP